MLEYSLMDGHKPIGQTCWSVKCLNNPGFRVHLNSNFKFYIKKLVIKIILHLTT
jgi:hypothetical protein